jgi:hypothetical protein
MLVFALANKDFRNKYKHLIFLIVVIIVFIKIIVSYDHKFKVDKSIKLNNKSK